MKNYKKMIAHLSKGKPLKSKQYLEEIEKGIDDIKAGRTISDADLSKEIETW